MGRALKEDNNLKDDQFDQQEKAKRLQELENLERRLQRIEDDDQEAREILHSQGRSASRHDENLRWNTAIIIAMIILLIIALVTSV
jgi:hypothetical protein